MDNGLPDSEEPTPDQDAVDPEYCGFFPHPSAGLGELEMDEELAYYDGPLLFTAHNDAGTLFLATALAAEPYTARYLYVPMSEECLSAFLRGEVDQLAAVQNSGGGDPAIVAMGRDRLTTIEFVKLADLPEADLPTAFRLEPQESPA